MFCCYCGKSIPDDAKFCGYCGKTTPENFKNPDSVETQPASEPVAPKNTGFVPAAPECKNPPKATSQSTGYRLTQYGSSAQSGFYSQIEQNKLTYQQIYNHNWRNFVASPMVIIAVIFYCIVTIYNIAATQASMELAYDMLDELNMDELSSLMMSMQFFSYLPNILISVGMILIVIDGFRSKTMPVSSAGIQMIRITMIVVYSIVGVIVAFVILSILGVASQSKVGEEAMGALMIGFMLGIGFGVFYICCIFAVINNALYGIRNGNTDNSKVIVLAVFQFIFVGVSLLSVVVEDMLDFGTILQLSSNVCMGIVLVMYNSMLNTTYYMQLNNVKS